jgi:hypothetical protein
MSNKSGHFYIPFLLGDIAFVTKLHVQIKRGPYLGVRIPKTDKAYVMHSVFNLNLSSIRILVVTLISQISGIYGSSTIHWPPSELSPASIEEVGGAQILAYISRLHSTFLSSPDIHVLFVSFLHDIKCKFVADSIQQ